MPDGSQMVETLSRDFWIGIFNWCDYASNARVDERVGARRRAAVVRMRLERNVGCRASRAAAGLLKRVSFGVLEFLVNDKILRRRPRRWQSRSRSQPSGPGLTRPTPRDASSKARCIRRRSVSVQSVVTFSAVAIVCCTIFSRTDISCLSLVSILPWAETLTKGNGTDKNVCPTIRTGRSHRVPDRKRRGRPPSRRFLHNELADSTRLRWPPRFRLSRCRRVLSTQCR